MNSINPNVPNQNMGSLVGAYGAKNEFIANFNNEHTTQDILTNPINLNNNPLSTHPNQGYQVRINNNKPYKYNTNYNNFHQSSQSNNHSNTNQPINNQTIQNQTNLNQMNQNPNFNRQNQSQSGNNNGFINKSNLTINNNTYQNITTFYTPNNPNSNTGNQGQNYSSNPTFNNSNKFSNSGNPISRMNNSNFGTSGVSGISGLSGAEFDSEPSQPSHYSMNESLNEDLLNLSLSQISQTDKEVGSNISVLEKSKDKKNFKNIQETLKSNTMVI